MSLNCLPCNNLQKTDSDRSKDYGKERTFRNLGVSVERSWSGNIIPPQYEKMNTSIRPITVVEKIKMGHRRVQSTGGVSFETSNEPRLVRSPGMRRDWSFEDLNGKGEKEKRFS